MLFVVYVMLVLCTLRACIVNISVRRRMFCTHVICAYSATCAELGLIVPIYVSAKWSTNFADRENDVMAV